MKSVSSCYQSRISEILPGTVFVAEIGTELTHCFAIEPLPGERVPGYLAISPGHPMLKDQVGVLSGSTISHSSILVYPDAQFVPSPNREHIKISMHYGLPNGSLILSENKFSIVAASDRFHKSAYDCVDGSNVSQKMNDPNRIVFISWEIVIEDPGGEPFTLCVVNAPYEKGQSY